jgi:mannose-1-phosphate guanylyltransferase / mannose-6-phosphate isomerase
LPGPWRLHYDGRVTIQPIILAGGSGTRLWPASRQGHPKQLLALTGDLTLLQETALRLRDFKGGPASSAAAPGAPAAGRAAVAPDPIVVTGEDYRFVIAGQLREVGVETPLVILEPAGRNTAPALTLAALLCPHCEGDPVLMVMASDHFITDLPAFHAAVAEGAELAAVGLLVTFGIVPTRPETGYGYLRTGEPAPGAPTARALAEFVEKPDAATARSYLEDGRYLWNSGIFMMRRSVWLEALEHYRPDVAAACRAACARPAADGPFMRVDKEAFLACPSDSIDYAVMEKLPPGAAVAVPLDCGWSDVGAWGALWAVCEKDGDGNVAKGSVILEDTRGSLVHADSRLVTVLGADDLVVVETADAVLVAPKDKTQDLKPLVARVKDFDEALTVLHRKVHRPWGKFDSIDRGDRFQVKRITVLPGAKLSLQLHNRRAEHWVVVRGEAEVTCGDKTFRLREDESTYVPVGTPHRLYNPGPEPLEIIEVQSGDYLGEDDIVRLEDSYGRLEG